MFKRILYNFTRNIAASASIGYAYSRYEMNQFDMKFLIEEIPTYKAQHERLETLLKELGVNKKVKLGMPSRDDCTIAASSSIPFSNIASISISPEEITKVYAKIKDQHTKSEIIKAILAHEVVHINEDHKFHETTIASLAFMIAYDISTLLRFNVLQRYLYPLAVCKIFLLLLSKHMEYRADYVAAKKDPAVCKTLISIFSSEESCRSNQNTLFSNHPNISSRIKSLEKVKKEHDENESCNKQQPSQFAKI